MSDGYPEPPAVGGEADTLLGSLERQRATFAWKCADLGDTEMRVAVGASSITLGGLLHHLAYMEDLNFTRDLSGAELPSLWTAEQRSSGGWTVPDQADAAFLRIRWAESVARSRAVVRAALASGGPDTRYRPPGGRPHTIRRLLVDMVEEYARHTGHADLIRESLDGRVGEDPPGRRIDFHL